MNSVRTLTVIGVAILFGLSGCENEPVETDSLGDAAKTFMDIALEFGEIEGDYVDAYYGPPELREQAKAASTDQNCSEDPAPCLDALAGRAQQLADTLNQQTATEAKAARLANLRGSVRALQTRIAMQQGQSFKFAEESERLYDAQAPVRPGSFFQAALNDINELLPGDGSLSDRVNSFRSQFVIPPERLGAVFEAAIEECRKRTKVFIELPEQERFRVEYVTDKPWSGYNWYQGDYYSLIQINTDLPIFIDRAVDLGCHEGYPGHHTYNVLLEKNLVNDKGWVEFSLYPLFSPQSLIAEGSANYGIDMAFPGTERLRFEKENLFPLAGLDKDKADQYFQLRSLMDRLKYAGNEAARHYLNGSWSDERAQGWLVDYNLMAPDRAAQRVRFIDKYRSYVINYNLGYDIVDDFIRAKVPNGQNAERWRVFTDLLSLPHMPSDMIISP